MEGYFFGRDNMGMTRLACFLVRRSSFIRRRRFLAALVRGRRCGMIKTLRL